MNVTKEERLSALVDDEADPFEVRRLTDELGRDQEFLARWARYHLIGDAIRQGLAPRLPKDFTDRIRTEIATPQPVTGPVAGMRKGAVRPVIGLGMAAAVALVAVIGVQNLMTEAPPVTPVPVLAGNEAAPEAGVVRVAEAERPAESAQARVPDLPRVRASTLDMADARLNSYIVNHAEHAGGRGIMPYVRVVGYQARGE